MKKEIISMGVLALAGIYLFGCNSSQRSELKVQNEANLRREKQISIGMPNPSAVYCVKLGYTYNTVTDEKGGQYGVCIFPDNSECKGWDFYRGKCGQPWSYCTQRGYDLKDLGQWEGWIKARFCTF
ncbi:MAG: DUF333 domain-containing protein [Planctomycetes bacterium]|nr:DUF333 domain-containing protein [Planctomycetota bacterium]